MKKYTAVLCLALMSLFAAPAAAQANEGYVVTPDKVRLFYKIAGQGSETLVVVHGGPGNSMESIRADMEPMAKGRRVIYYDQRGQGRSEVITDGKKLGYEQHVADLEAVRQHFGLNKMTLLSNSWGGLLISLYAIKYPDRVERMVLADPAPPMQGFLSDMQNEIAFRMGDLYTQQQRDRYGFLQDGDNWLKASDPYAICREFYRSVLTTYTYSQTFDIGFKGDLCTGPKENVRQQMKVNSYVWRSLCNFNLVPKLGAVTAPVLVIHGAADVIPLKASELWASGYPNARLLLIEKAGHITHVERPDIFFPAVETFVKGTFPAEARKINGIGAN